CLSDCSEDAEREGCCSRPPPAPAKPAWRWLIGVSALSCQGLSTLWVGVGSALPAELSVNWFPYLEVVGRLPCPDDPTLVLAFSPEGPRGRQQGPLSEQPQTDHPGATQPREHQELLPRPGRRRPQRPDQCQLRLRRPRQRPALHRAGEPAEPDRLQPDGDRRR